MEWPELTILMVTYGRPCELRATLLNIFYNVSYPFIRLHIADDGTPDLFPDLVEWVGRYVKWPVTYTITNRQGWSVNVNTGIASIASKYIMLWEDDYLTTVPIDLRPYVACMEVDNTVGMVRFGIAGHDVTCTLDRAKIHDWLPGFKHGTGSPGEFHFMRIHRKGGIYLYSNRPHLRHKRFMKAYGLHTPGIEMGLIEQEMTHRYSDGKGPQIVCPIDKVPFDFIHIGVSRQRTPEDPCYDGAKA